jgi:hypothetical protein
VYGQIYPYIYIFLNELAQAKGGSEEQSTFGKHFHVEYFSGLLYTVKPVNVATSIKGDFIWVWFMRTIMTRFLKLIVSWSQGLCLVMEVVGCPVFGTLILSVKPKYLQIISKLLHIQSNMYKEANFRGGSDLLRQMTP